MGLPASYGYGHNMSSEPSGWLPLVLTTLGAGAIGAVISTYGTQTRERRHARAAAREALRDVENLTPSPDTRERVAAALDAFDTSAMLAGLPRQVTALHREARLRSCWYPDIPLAGDSSKAAEYEDTQRVTRRVAHQSCRTSDTCHMASLGDRALALVPSQTACPSSCCRRSPAHSRDSCHGE